MGTAQTTSILGTWRGTSTCVDRQHYPACTDEVVIYEVRAHGTGVDSVSIRADKIVDGVREFMGELQYARAADGSWIADFQNQRVHVRIVLHQSGDHLDGVMADVPTARRVRDIALTRSR